MARRKCGECGTREAIWACQPAGPDDHTTYTTLGSHYRGFLVIPMCDHCKVLREQRDAVIAEILAKQRKEAQS